MTSNERLTMMAEDYERRAVYARSEAANYRTKGYPANFVRAAHRTALKHEKSARECRETIKQNSEVMP